MLEEEEMKKILGMKKWDSKIYDYIEYRIYVEDVEVFFVFIFFRCWYWKGYFDIVY